MTLSLSEFEIEKYLHKYDIMTEVNVSMDFTTKMLIVAVIVLAAGLYYLYSTTQQFKVGMVNIVESLKNNIPSPSNDEVEDEDDEVEKEE